MFTQRIICTPISILLLFGTFSGFATAQPQHLSKSFEFRYVDDNPASNGETDFKGETEVFDTDKRIEFLGQYADYAKHFFNDPQLNKMVVTEQEVAAAMKSLKPQPLPEVRKTISLDQWKWLGYKDGQREENQAEISKWQKRKNLKVEDGCLVFTAKKTSFQQFFPAQSWRFFIQFKAKVPKTNQLTSFSLSGNKDIGATVGFNKDGQIFYNSEDKVFEVQPYKPDTWYEFKLEVDMVNSRYNLYVDGRLKADFVKFQNDQTKQIDTLSVESVMAGALDDIWAVGYAPIETPRRPYSITGLMDENFELKPSVENWNSPDYNDKEWKPDTLPIIHGGKRYAGEDIYLRKTIEVADFRRAVLNVEMIDPEGQIWVNGLLAATITDRRPAKVDISKFLKKNQANLIAVKVTHRCLPAPLTAHSPDDTNIGWYCARLSLDLTAKTYINEALVCAKTVGNPAYLQPNIEIINDFGEPFNGNVVVNFYPWHPNESLESAATAEFPVSIGDGCKHSLENIIAVPNPKLWSFENPNLYKVEVILEDSSGKAIDDYVFTTGIRTVSQGCGTFRINGKPELMTGALILGFRPPLDKAVKWRAWAPKHWMVKELLMLKKMNSNTARTGFLVASDPRFAEIGDQMGIMFVCQTSAGRWWGGLDNVDFEGYPAYIKQVYNHPSIIMWEITNEPAVDNYSELNLFYTKSYNTVYPVDQSRLICFCTNLSHSKFSGNDLGTIDMKGNPNPAPHCLEWTAHMATRANHTHITGYGKDWTRLRKWPHFEQDFLDSKERAFFNLEHEESIGQPNWSFSKGKPYYQVHSYEWNYDEGSIGRKLTADQWQESQGWQAFSAYESMRKQRIYDIDGFSWCCLHGGGNSATYQKPLIDFYGHAKLSFYADRMVNQKILAGSSDVDVVYGPDDVISPVALNIGDSTTVDIEVLVKNMNNKVVDSKTYKAVKLPPGRTVTPLDNFKPKFPSKGYYAIEYYVTTTKSLSE